MMYLCEHWHTSLPTLEQPRRKKFPSDYNHSLRWIVFAVMISKLCPFQALTHLIPTTIPINNFHYYSIILI